MKQTPEGERAAFWVLDEQDHPVPCCEFSQWSVWMVCHRFDYAISAYQDGILVSTVFLGMNYGTQDEPPELFESLVCGGNMSGKRVRYSTWPQAKAGHLTLCLNLGLLDEE